MVNLIVHLKPFLPNSYTHAHSYEAALNSFVTYLLVVALASSSVFLFLVVTPFDTFTATFVFTTVE